MSKETYPQKSRSYKIHRRRELSRFRQEATRLNQQVTEKVNARDRLVQIGKLLSPDDPTLSVMAPMEQAQNRASLEIEQIWLQFKLGIISQAEQQQSLSRKFDELEMGKPDVYHWLVDNAHGPSRAQQIRDKVIPPIYVGGYYTRR